MKKVIVFGLGQVFRLYQDWLYSNFDVVALTDNSEAARQSVDATSHTNVDVIPPDDICRYDFESIVIVVSDFFGKDSVKYQLLRYGIQPEKILFFTRTREIIHTVPSKGLVTWNGIDVSISSYSDYIVWMECLCNGAYDYLDNAFSWTVIDIGMNIGCASLFFASLPNVRTVYAYELVKSTFQMAISNFERNPCLYEKIQAFPFGLGNENSTVEIAVKEYSGGNSMIFETPDWVDVELCDVHKASDELGSVIDKISAEDNIAIKIDVEGAEYCILDDLYQSGLLEKIDMIVGEYHRPQRTEDGKKAVEKLVADLESAGFYVNGFDINAEIGAFQATRK